MTRKMSHLTARLGNGKRFPMVKLAKQWSRLPEKSTKISRLPAV